MFLFLIGLIFTSMGYEMVMIHYDRTKEAQSKAEYCISQVLFFR